MIVNRKLLQSLIVLVVIGQIIILVNHELTRLYAVNRSIVPSDVDIFVKVKTADVCRMYFSNRGQLGLKLEQEIITGVNKNTVNVTSSLLTNIPSPEIPKVTLQNGHNEERNGFDLAMTSHNVCLSSRATSIEAVKGMFYVPNKRIIFCPMEKVGTTFWRKVFTMKVVRNGTLYKHPYEVPLKLSLSSKRLYTRSFSLLTRNKLLTDSSFNILFVRNPYSRLLSAFVDKLVPPNPYYWEKIGGHAIAKYRPNQRFRSKIGDGHDVTFAEFVKHVVNAEKTGIGLDEHFASTFRSCKPCGVNYKYIGRMESFGDDALFILKKMGMNFSAESLRKDHTFMDLSVDDAITDSIYSPFSWKEKVMKIISWEKALRRVWLKLQMCGIVGFSQIFNLTRFQVNTYTADKFIDYARKAHKRSDPNELKKQKVQVKTEAFRNVPINDLIAFRETYKHDFALFGYYPAPDYIFSREGQAPSNNMFNYPHLN